MASLVVPLFLTPPARAIGRARRITHMSAACASSSTASSSSEQQQRVASNSSREQQQQQQQAAAAIAAAVVNSTYPPVGPYTVRAYLKCISNVYPTCISRMYLPYIECISVNISYLSRMISQYHARLSYKKVYKALYNTRRPPASTSLKRIQRHHDLPRGDCGTTPP